MIQRADVFVGNRWSEQRKNSFLHGNARFGFLLVFFFDERHFHSCRDEQWASCQGSGVALPQGPCALLYTFVSDPCVQCVDVLVPSWWWCHKKSDLTIGERKKPAEKIISDGSRHVSFISGFTVRWLVVFISYILKHSGTNTLRRFVNVSTLFKNAPVCKQPQINIMNCMNFLNGVRPAWCFQETKTVDLRNLCGEKWWKRL